MDTYQAVVGKRDVRAFTDEPVDSESLRKILQAGRMAGSSKATEPCRFVVVRDLEQRKRLAASGAFAGWIHTAPVNVAVVLLPGGGPFDAGRCAQNMMIVAHALGLGSCPVSVQERAIEVLGLPEDHRVAIVLAIGHVAPGTDGRLGRGRRPLEEYVHYERWGAS